MEIFYKGNHIDIQETGIATGIRIKDMNTNEEHVVSRRLYMHNTNYPDIVQVKEEIDSLIDNGEFTSIKQLPDHAPAVIMD